MPSRTRRATTPATPIEPVDHWLSLPQAAQALGESRQTVLARAARGELAAAVVAGRTVISRESVAEFQRKSA